MRYDHLNGFEDFKVRLNAYFALYPPLSFSADATRCRSHRKLGARSGGTVESRIRSRTVQKE